MAFAVHPRSLSATPRFWFIRGPKLARVPSARCLSVLHYMVWKSFREEGKSG
jgi:hypothetical protein